MSISESAYRRELACPFSGDSIILIDTPMLLPKRFISHLVGTAVFSLSLATGHAQKADEKLSIVVIPKGTTHVFWKAVQAGAQEGAKEAGVEMVWKGPLKEDDRAQQIAIVEQFVSEGVGGIVLAPLDDTALKRPVSAAMAKGIPVVIMDSALKGEPGKDFVSTVSTNNHRGGEMAGEELGKILGGKGKVVLLRYQEGSASTGQREAGFLEAIKKFPDIQVILDNRYSGATASEAQSTALNILDKLKEADGIFCPNESSTFGMLLALKQNNLATNKKLVGFDTSPPLIDALKKGEIQALVAQNPKKMGHEAVKALVAKMKGETVPTVVDSGAAVITKENMDTPEIQALLK
jgi:ribose transport system substrate-binding protein